MRKSGEMSEKVAICCREGVARPPLPPFSLINGNFEIGAWAVRSLLAPEGGSGSNYSEVMASVPL